MEMSFTLIRTGIFKLVIPIEDESKTLQEYADEMELDIEDCEIASTMLGDYVELDHIPDNGDKITFSKDKTGN